MYASKQIKQECKKVIENKETCNQTYKFTNKFKRHKANLIRLQVFKHSNTQTIKHPNVQTSKRTNKKSKFKTRKKQ